ncbi:unnamed protein product, partial [Rodentolepis nana]|uniref:Axin_b-cat_bind domain-containing protein n=1 Tax=Rodentolepis nana TaxID=102285 RepID=A0A0R3TJV8_RODNA
VLNFPCETQGEQAFQQIIGQKLIGLHLPPQQTIVSILKELLIDLRTLREEKQMINLMRQKHQLFMSPRQPHDNSMLTSPLSDPGASGTGAQLPGILRHSSERHFGILEGGQIRPFSQVEFRQSLLRRTSGKRITAHDGSRFLNHHRTLSQRKPILTASVESLPRQSGPPGALERRHRTSNDRIKGELRRAMTSTGRIDKSAHELMNLTNRAPSSRDNDFGDDETACGVEELNAPANPLIAAAVATSLYGSAAPYAQVREKAREELPDLIGLTEPPEPLSSHRRASTNPLKPSRSNRLIDNIPLVDLHFSPSTSFPTSPAAPTTPPPPNLEDPQAGVPPASFQSNPDPSSHTDTSKKINYV